MTGHWPQRFLYKYTAFIAMLILAACTGDDSSHSSQGIQSSSASANINTPSSMSSSSIKSSKSSQNRKSSADGGNSSTPAPQPASCDSHADVLKVFERNNCMLCHNASIFGANGGNLNLESPTSGAYMLDRNTLEGGASCTENKLIDSRSWSDSLLLKLIDPTRHTQLKAQGCNRNTMPQNGGIKKTADIRCVEQWVKEVIATEQPIVPVDDTPQAFKAVGAAEAIMKAKYILHGGATTEEEFEAVNNNGTLDPAALRTVIQKWQNSKAYELKMKDFFDLSLQQSNLPRNFGYSTQFDNFSPAGANRHMAQAPQLYQSLNDMTVMRVWDIVKKNQNFTQIVSTRKWKVTTAILVAMAYAEKPVATAGVSFPQRSKYGDLLARFDLFEDSDMNDWRYVTFKHSKQPLKYEKSAAFLSRMRAVKDGDTIEMRFPRTGYYSMPRFLEYWPTNEGNQFRVTASQTLITALDAAFSPGDATPHALEDGIDRDHAKPGTACYECHRHMDPLRLVFQNYQEFNHRAKVADTRIQPYFSFMGVSKPMETPEDFGRILAQHPRFPIAWVQKLCMWGNSQRCIETDPEFIRLTKRFKNSGFKFNLLVREFFSSPIFTASKMTKTHEKSEYLVSLSRANHFCRAATQRELQLRKANGTTGSYYLCNERQGTFGVVPKDDFARGEVDFVQSTQVGLFDAKSIDSECARRRGLVFGRLISDSKNADESIKQLVEIVMGMPTGHPRYPKTKNELKRIYNIASHKNSCTGNTLTNQGQNVTCGLGLNKKAALQYAWIAACTSPEFIGIGF